MRSGIDVAVPLREAEVTFLTGGFIHSLADRDSCRTELFQDEVFSTQVNAPEMKGTRGKPVWPQTKACSPRQCCQS